MRHALAIAGLLVLTIAASAQDAKPAPQPLWPGGAPGAQGKDDKDIPSILLYPAPADKANGAAVVVCPGGGYGGLAIDLAPGERRSQRVEQRHVKVEFGEYLPRMNIRGHIEAKWRCTRPTSLELPSADEHPRPH